MVSVRAKGRDEFAMGGFGEKDRMKDVAGRRIET